MAVASQHVAVGRIGRPHGTRGEVRLDPQGGLPRGLAGYTRFYIDRAGSLEPVEIEAHRTHGRFLRVKFRGIDTPEAARAITHTVLCVDRQELPPLGPGEYYYHDLVGCRVLDEGGTELGQVVDVFDSGAHDVLRIRQGTGEWMLPVLERWVRSIDCDGRVVVVRPPEGLRD